MGLFDEVRCEHPLPDGKPSVVFQTKTFDDPYMIKYTIRADGRLIRKARWYLDDDQDADMNYHGILNFYSLDDKTREWREFNAKFTDGYLVSIDGQTIPTQERE